MSLLVNFQCNIVLWGVLFVVSERLFGFRLHREFFSPCENCTPEWNVLTGNIESIPDPEIAVGVSVICMFVIFNLLVSTGSSEALPLPRQQNPAFQGAGGPRKKRPRRRNITGATVGGPMSSLAVPKPSQFEKWMQSLSLEELMEVAVKHTIFFEIPLRRTSPQESWGFEVDKGDDRAWTVSKVAAGGAADRCVSPAKYYDHILDKEFLDEVSKLDLSNSSPSGAPNENGSPLKLQPGDMIFAINNVVSTKKFAEQMKKVQDGGHTAVKLAIVRTVYWANSRVNVPADGENEDLKKADECFAALTEHLKKRLSRESGGGTIRLVSQLPEEHETKATRTFIVNQNDVPALENFRKKPQEGKPFVEGYDLGICVVKASAHTDGRESLYVQSIDQNGIMYRFCSVREGDFIDAINGKSENLAEAMKLFSRGLKAGTQFECRREHMPGLRLAFQRQDCVIQGAVNCCLPVLPFAFDNHGKVCGADPNHELSYGDRMVLVNQKQSFLQMAKEYSQASTEPRFRTETGAVLVPSHIVSRADWAAIESTAVVSVGNPNNPSLEAAMADFRRHLEHLGKIKKYTRQALKEYAAEKSAESSGSLGVGGAGTITTAGGVTPGRSNTPSGGEAATSAALQSLGQKGDTLRMTIANAKHNVRERFSQDSAAKTQLIEKLERAYVDLGRLNEFIVEYDLT